MSEFFMFEAESILRDRSKELEFLESMPIPNDETARYIHNISMKKVQLHEKRRKQIIRKERNKTM